MRTRTLLGLMAWSAMLCGCADDPEPPPARPADERPPDGVVPKPDPAPPEAPALVVRVFREDSDRGVAAQVSRLDSAGQARFVANVDDTGIARLAEPCPSGDRLDAEPRVPNYLRVEPQPCASTVTFRLYGAQATMMLLQAAEDDERSGNFTGAQQKYSQVAIRLRYSRPEEAERAQLGAYRNAGAALGVDEAASVVGGRESPQLTERLQRYQRDANLPVTGTLDERTQETLLRRGATVAPQ